MAAETRKLQGHVPRAVQQLQPIGREPGGNRLRLTIGLSLHNAEALTNLLEKIYDPASPQFRHYLSPGQFNQVFGPTEQDYQRVMKFATTNGFTITNLHANRVLLAVNASVADVESAFHVHLLTYRHPVEDRLFYAPDTDPSVAADLPILDISGLDNFQLPHPKMHPPRPLRQGAGPTPHAGSGPNGTFAGLDYRAAYAPDVALDGTGQSVGLLEFDGYYANDITAYESQVGLPNVPLQNVLLDGFNGVPTRGRNSGNVEVALDIEMAISMAPGLTQVVVFEAGPLGLPNDVLSAMSDNPGLSQLSCSWSFGTTPRSTMDQLFQKMAAQGQSFFDASGDSGAYSGPIAEPDDDPYLTSVGGTALVTTGPVGPWVSETVWNAGDGQSSSGGASTTYGIPIWQQGINMSANHGSTTHRNVPDVAMVADGIFIVADNGQPEISGGTSAAAPLWAGFTALVNQLASGSGLPAVGFLNPALYAIGKSSAYASDFNDVVSGNNANNNPSEFVAVPGYDLCTGWGTPAGISLIYALANPDALGISPARGFVANGPQGGPFTTALQNFSLTDSSANAIDWTISPGPPWLDLSVSSGSLSPASPQATVTMSLNSAANQLTQGVYVATLWFTNLTSGVAQNRQLTLAIRREMIQDGGFEAGDFAYWALAGTDAIDNNFVDNGTSTHLQPFTGTYFAVLGQTNSLGYLSQVVPTRPGQLYLLTFWLQSADVGAGTIPNEFVVNWGAHTALDDVDLAAFGWRNFQLILQADTNSTLLAFGFRDDPAYLTLDNVSLLAITLPVIQASLASDGTITLGWNTVPGTSYQVQYTTSLSSPNWLDLNKPVAANGSTANVTDTPEPDLQRFYRVVVVSGN
jgi:hypothetical protein